MASSKKKEHPNPQKPMGQTDTILKLRQKLFKEHFETEEKDIISSEFWLSLKAQAHKNTEIYRRIFPYCYPDDQIQTQKNLEDWILRFKSGFPDNFKTYQELKDQIKGQVVEFPMNFLKDIPNLSKAPFKELLYN